MRGVLLASILLSAGAAGCGSRLYTPYAENIREPGEAPDWENEPPPRPPLTVAVAPAAPKNAANDIPLPPRAPLDLTTACPLHWDAKDIHMGPTIIPVAIWKPVMEPLYSAVCVCTRPGENLYLSARIVPEHATITVTATEPEGRRPRPDIDSCFSRVLKTGLFERFEMGSDAIVDCPAYPDPKQKGPPFFHFPRTPGCEPDRFTTVLYPVYADRRGEAGM